MTRLDPGRPEAGEYIPYYDQYIRLVPTGDIVALLEQQIGDTVALAASFTPARARWRPAPEEWCATEIVGHLADVERIFVYRALKIARADPVPWESFEPEDYVAAAHFDERPLVHVVAEYAAVRAATVAFLRGLDAAVWERRAPEGWSCRSVRAFAYILAGHELHHTADLPVLAGGAAAAG